MAIQKDAESLLKSISALDDTYIQVTSDFKKMDGIINELKASWAGSGGDAFRGAQAAFQAQAARVTEIMTTFSEKLGQAEKTYGVTEDEIAGAYNRHAGGLGG